MDDVSPDFDNIDSTNVTERKRGGRSRGRSRTVRGINEDIQEADKEVNAEFQEIFKKNKEASLLVGALKGHNARKEARQLQEEERIDKLKEQVDKENAEDQARIELYDPPATKINNAVRGHLARKEKEKLKKNSVKIDSLIAKMDAAHDNLDKAIGHPEGNSTMTWETVKKKFDAATTLSKMVQRHMQMKKYNKDELTLKNAKLDKVNVLLDQSIKEQEKEAKSRKIKKAFLLVKRFWQEDVNKEAQTQAEDRIGAKVKSLQEKRNLLQEQRDKGEELYKTAQAKGIDKK
jgi:hypothetical protein